ncbi:hypothetical protein HZS_5659, partial [Henneguya salminicola]
MQNQSSPQKIEYTLDEECDEKILSLLLSKSIKVYNMEKYISNYERCIFLRRKYIELIAGIFISDSLKYRDFEYNQVFHRCCENVIGFVGIPVGIVGPILLNGHKYYVPLATTEGCLVASTSRGATCVSVCGVKGFVINDGITRAPLIRTDSVQTALQIKNWIQLDDNFTELKKRFDNSS